LADGRSRRRRVSCAFRSDPRSALRRSYAPRRTSASRPRRTVSVSVRAPDADFASRNRLSSIWSVFFIHTIVPTAYGPRPPASQSAGLRNVGGTPVKAYNSGSANAAPR
jgi:hypothetical protein